MRCEVLVRQKEPRFSAVHEDWCEEVVESAWSMRERGEDKESVLHPQKRLNLRRQMATASGKKESVSNFLVLRGE